MQRSQKTLESYGSEDRSETESTDRSATSMRIAQSMEQVTHDDLMKAVVDDDNIDRALKRVVGNRGAPGVDGMAVDDLEPWLHNNREDFRNEILNGNYIPTPVRRKEIPKDSGGVRKLGIPTAKDRLVQQMVAQVLTPIYDPTFSESSFGFRPGRSAQDAVKKAVSYIEDGYIYGIGIDLEKFFDTLPQRELMNVLRERIKDRVLIQLIKRFLRAGVVLPDGLTQATESGAPQGGPLSPLLSNIYLDRLDKELESRGLRFCRYADDSIILVRSERAAGRVCETVTRFLEEELHLKVNRDKTEVGSVKGMSFLGFTFYRNRGAGAYPSRKAQAKFRKRIRELTKRNRGVSPEAVLRDLRTYERGWFGYFRIGLHKDRAGKLDSWIRRRVRQYFMKCWKNQKTKWRNLAKLCPQELRCPDGTPSTLWTKQVRAVACRSGYWAPSNYPAVKNGMDIKWLRNQGMYFLSDNL